MAHPFYDPPTGEKWSPPRDRPTWPQKCHYQSHHGSDHDAMAKRRLASRTFGFKRLSYYPTRDMVEPARTAPYYATDEERLSTDIDGFARECQRKYKQRKDDLLKAHKAEKAFRQFKLVNDREDSWNKNLEREDFYRNLPHGRVQANKSGVHYNIISLKYDDSYGGRLVKYEDDMKRWREILRKLFLRSKSTGCQSFDILNWKRRSPAVYPDKPEAPQPDPPAPPKARVATVMVYPKRPPDITPVVDGKLPEQLFDPTPEPPKEEKLRDVVVHPQHPWDLTHPGCSITASNSSLPITNVKTTQDKNY